MKLNEAEIDKSINEIKKETSKTADEVLAELKTKNSSTTDIVNNNKKQVTLGELGSFDRVTKEECENVLDRLSGTVFKLGKCYFRVCSINKGQQRFSAELVNGQY